MLPLLSKVIMVTIINFYVYWLELLIFCLASVFSIALAFLSMPLLFRFSNERIPNRNFMPVDSVVPRGKILSQNLIQLFLFENVYLAKIVERVGT